ncbi:MAG: polysaccharide deacetylase family protein [Dehalococcoidia bacterium]
MANAPGPRRLVLALAALPLLLACTVPAAPAPAAPPAPPAPAVGRTDTATSTPSASPTATPTATPTPRTRMVVPAGAVEVERGTSARREIAFTFDCAAHSGPTDEILRVLREERVRVTWFMVGVWARDHQELTKEIAREHEIANHSWAHPDYRDLSAAEIAADLEENERFLLALTGQTTKPLWRAPSGARDQRVLEAAAAAGWPLHIFWTIGHDERGIVTGDTGDWRGIPAAEVWANTVRAAGLGPGLITVSHCDAPATAQVMRDTIRLFRERGLEIVTVSELLRP